MRVTAQARIYLPGDMVFREPGLLDKISHFLGSDVDLTTGEQTLTRTALALTEQIRAALAHAKITNALNLVVDDDIVFSDTESAPDDAGILVAAMQSAAARFERGFETLRAVFEHQHDGLSTVIEVTVHKKHGTDDPSATFAFGSRILALRPGEDEDLKAARERIGRLLADKHVLTTARSVLAALVDDVQRGCMTAFPRGRIDVTPADISMRKPGVLDVKALEFSELSGDDRNPFLVVVPNRTPSTSVYYDPWQTWYQDPVDTWATVQILSAMTRPDPAWGYKPGSLGDKWHSAGVNLPVVNALDEPFIEGRNIGDEGKAGYFAGIAQVADIDLDASSWDDDAMDLYTESEKETGAWDCAPAASSDCSTSSSWDCSTDCSSDCSYDCSSDCSWDCSSDCSDWD